MPSAFTDTLPRPGDTKVDLLRKISQSLGESWFSNDLEWDLVARILRSFGGTPSQGDSIMLLWQKIRIALGDTECVCGDDEWQAMRKALSALGGRVSPADSVYNLLYKFAQIVQAGPEPCDIMNDWGSVSGIIICFEDWFLLSGPIVEFEDWGSV